MQLYTLRPIIFGYLLLTIFAFTHSTRSGLLSLDIYFPISFHAFTLYSLVFGCWLPTIFARLHFTLSSLLSLDAGFLVSLHAFTLRAIVLGYLLTIILALHLHLRILNMETTFYCILLFNCSYYLYL